MSDGGKRWNGAAVGAFASVDVVFVDRVQEAPKEQAMAANPDVCETVAASPVPSDTVRTLARSAYLRLRSLIIRGELPPLHQLKIASLARELSVNSSAVREALSRLTAEHLVEARDQQGFRVVAISLEDLEDLTRTRIDIETMMLRRAIEADDDEWKMRLRRAHRAMSDWTGSKSGPEGVAVHGEFHEALLAACGSPHLLRIRESLFELSQRYRSFAIYRAGPEWRIVQEHDEIAAAALAGDADRASAALADHIAGTLAIVRTAMTAALPSDVPESGQRKRVTRSVAANLK